MELEIKYNNETSNQSTIKGNSDMKLFTLFAPRPPLTCMFTRKYSNHET